MTATHNLESRAQPSAGFKYNKARSYSLAGEPRTDIISRLKVAITAATHLLESQGQVLSAGFKCTGTQQPLTSWRTKDRHFQHA